jgi:signal transduction histidine kinase
VDAELDSEPLEEQIRASRARLTAESDSRLQLERDLHDGVQQRVLAALMRVERARAAAAGLPEAVEQLDAVRNQLERLYDELRELADGAYPALLRDFGLEQALRAAAEQAVPSARVVSDLRGRYGSAIEETVYFCCLEALENVAQHAGPGASATVSLHAEDHRLAFEVADDGVGLGADNGDGSGRGLQDMRTRLAAVGGVLELDSGPARGTTVRGVVPVVEHDGGA